ncbi:hypothetical protein [Pseudidiomarina insulisalsae]|uniref:Uncharacterized protein n=1 Tax=Pseudidiomarina insulisalsae TaxID=575789 RepID=A0A432YHX0_9GAMM|nr:hypothetical protein [Pseudidiomarina insulisalsae]RUO60528.1 hypothetical protein CWI71_06580 [Pseudidiomarina insulisalsae]
MSNSTAKQRLDQLIQEAASGASTPAPERDLWRGIEHSLARRQRRSGKWLNWVWASAACLVLAVGGVTFMGMHEPAATATGTPPAKALLAYLNAQHEQQREFVLTHYQTAGWNGESDFVAAEVEQIRASIQEVSAQLLEEPDNQALWQLLQWLYNKELELLESQFVVNDKLQQV